jgi:hypothetical protein
VKLGGFTWDEHAVEFCFYGGVCGGEDEAELGTVG